MAGAAIEAFEDASRLVRGEPDSLIADLDRDTAVIPLGTYRDWRAGRRVFDRILDELCATTAWIRLRTDGG